METLRAPIDTLLLIAATVGKIIRSIERHIGLGNWGTALDCCIELIEEGEAEAKVYFYAGVCNWKMGDKFNAACFFLKALEMDANFEGAACAHHYLGLELLERGTKGSVKTLINKALEHFQAAIKLNQSDASNGIYFNCMANCLAMLLRLEEAVNYYGAALAALYKPEKVLFNQGICLYRLGRYTEARQNFHKILGLNPNHAMAAIWMAKAQLKLGTLPAKDELKQLTGAIERAIPRLEAQAQEYYAASCSPKVKVYAVKSGYCVPLPGIESAAAQLYATIKTNPPDFCTGKNLHAMANYLALMGRLQEALEWYDAAAIAPYYSQTKILFNRGICVYCLGYYEAALLHFEQLLKSNADHAKANYWVAKCMNKIKSLQFKNGLHETAEAIEEPAAVIETTAQKTHNGNPQNASDISVGRTDKVYALTNGDCAVAVVESDGECRSDFIYRMLGQAYGLAANFHVHLGNSDMAEVCIRQSLEYSSRNEPAHAAIALCQKSDKAEMIALYNKFGDRLGWRFGQEMGEDETLLLPIADSSVSASAGDDSFESSTAGASDITQVDPFMLPLVDDSAAIQSDTLVFRIVGDSISPESAMLPLPIDRSSEPATLGRIEANVAS